METEPLFYNVTMQPDPIPNDKPHIADLLIEEIRKRKQIGIERYGVALQPFNGRDPLRDALDEAIDLCKYLLQAIVERDSLKK